MLSPQFEQLKMFMSPREISGRVDHYGDFGANPEKGKANPRPPHEVGEHRDKINYKIHNSAESGLRGSIESEGVKKPVEIGYFESDKSVALADGHHRTMAQSQADPDRLMPVVHSAGWGNENVKAFPVMGDQWRDPTGSSTETIGSFKHKVRK